MLNKNSTYSIKTCLGFSIYSVNSFKYSDLYIHAGLLHKAVLISGWKRLLGYVCINMKNYKKVQKRHKEND